MSLQELNLKTHYETGPDDLIHDFYVPVLQRATHYDRFASYFTSVSLAAIGEGLIEFVENEGKIRLIVNTSLDEEDFAVLKGEREAPSETLREIFDPTRADNEVEEIRWKVLAWLLDNDKLEIKVGTTPPGRPGIFHPKLGILQDEEENIVTFEGSNNETFGGLVGNFERFKVHASWKPGHREHIDGDIASFETIWDGEHDFVNTYDLPEALEQDILEVAPEDKEELIREAERVLPERLREIASDQLSEGISESAYSEILNNAGKAVGGTHIAETASTVTPWPHQRIVSDTLYSTYPKGFLLCDEVGLGKTIEAGLTISRLVHTEEAQSCLILAPANLTKQWQEELWEKFNLNTYLYDKSTGGYVFTDSLGREHEAPAVKEDEYAWADSPVWRFVHEKNRGGEPAIIIASWHLARMSRHQDTFAPRENGTTRTVDDVEASCRGRDRLRREGVWDLTIVDEAHKARRRDFRKIVENAKGTPNNLLSLLRDLTKQSQCFYLLTATPMQVHSIELFDLLSIVGIPDEWDDPKRFLDFYRARIALSDVLHDRSPDHTGDAQIKDGKVLKQQTLASDDDILTRIGHHLEADRNVARALVLKACEMVRAYDRAQKHRVYPEEFLAEIRRSGEQRYLQYLLRDEDAYIGMVDRRKFGQAVENLSRAGWKLVLRAFEEATPVDVVLHRNTRDILREYHRTGLLDESERVPTRKVRNRELELNGAGETYEHIEDYVKKFYQRARDAEDEHVRTTGLVMTVYRQRMTSSFHAIQKSLESRLGKLEDARDLVEDALEHRTPDDELEWFDPEEFDSDVSPDEAGEVYGDLEELDNVIGVNPNDLEGSQRLIDEEIAELDSFIDQVRDIITDQDPKLVRLREDIQEINEQGRDLVMVFTQYGDTLEMIRNSLVLTYGSQVGCYSGRGGEMYIDGEWRNVGKERVKQEFSSGDGDVEILVCTESASHGLNLQNCGALINYDLPWNPMRVEQRIGRIDRIGQAYQDIWIYNYFYEDTVERDVYEALQDRVGLFEEYVGGMQPIISNAEMQIQKSAMEGEDVSVEEEESDESYEHIRSMMEYNVVEEARLNGWDEFTHPDMGEISATPTYSNILPVEQDSVEELLVGSELIESLGARFMAIEDVVDDSLYRLEIPRTQDWKWTENHLVEPLDNTLAAQLTSSTDECYEVAITFSPDIADEYPSLRLFTFGEPLFDAFIEFLDTRTASSSKLQLVRMTRDGTELQSGDDEWLVCGWEDSDDPEVSEFCVNRETIRDWVAEKIQLEELLS